MSTFDEKLAWGSHAERAVSEWLQTRGWYVLPTYDYSGLSQDKAPKMEGSQRSLVIPDLLAARFGKTCWLEVKRKTSTTFTRMTGRHETGLPRRLWDDYLNVQDESGLDAWVLFVHDKENEIRGGKISELSVEQCPHGSDFGLIPTAMPILRHQKNGSMGPMVFFCWDCLTHIAHTADVLGNRIEA